ncbi:MAG: P1 family peptidase [Firmicutes bacterium]|nr:P1 family peptidase [Bacillota bacterium]
MTDANGARPRARDIGIDIGIFRPGRWNAITDAPGVTVGHVTLVEGEGRLVPGRGPVRTGVTAILPHGGNLFREKVPAAAYVLNGFGKSIGLHQVNELGNLETPIALANTLNVPIVADAVIEWSIKRSPEIGIGTGTVNPVVGEVNDGILNDIQGRHVRKEHVFEAIANARSGAVQEGSVGAGTGGVCMGWKGGIGTSSRVLPPRRGGYTVGVLVQTNFGGVLTVNGAPVGRELGRYSNCADFPYEIPETGDAEGADPGGIDPEIRIREVNSPDGSVMVIVATDAPLDQRQLERLAKRAGLGLARIGFYSSNGSGDFFIAFSTAGRIPHDSPLTAKAEVVSNDSMSPLFLAVVEATEEAVINSMLKATTVVGRDGTMVDAIDIDQLLEVMGKYNALNWSRTLPPRGRRA